MWAIAAIAVLAVLAGVAWWLFSSLDWLVKHAIESRGPAITGTSVSVASVRISTLDGRGTLAGIVIGNPPGFASPHAFRANAISVAIDPATLVADVPVIREIVIDAPDVVYENAGRGGNLEILQRNIGNAAQHDAPAARSKGEMRKAPRRFVIDRILIRQARVSVLSPLLRGGTANFVLPDIELRGLGSSGHGVTAAEAANQVVSAMAARIAVNAALSSDVLKKGLEGALDSLLNRRK
jgi:hypothetical protein